MSDSSAYKRRQEELKEYNIYTYVIKSGNSENKGIRRTKEEFIKYRVGIKRRPKIVKERKRFADLEEDLIIGKNHNQAILTINDRVSGLLKIRKVSSKEAKIVSKAIVEELKD